MISILVIISLVSLLQAEPEVHQGKPCGKFPEGCPRGFQCCYDACCPLGGVCCNRHGQKCCYRRINFRGFSTLNEMD
uniref:Cysteine rich secreted protein n=1 Tax=Riptortus pedestris TaxID=329032 RepID=R4WQY2_RIPPE|nr:cysteine rich secreted protein [Riptortus pedestris]